MKTLREIISDKCVECGLCQKECAFLQRRGAPKSLASGRRAASDIPFECSLCGLCSVVCPLGLDPARMFRGLRGEAVARGDGDYPEHAVIRGYERRGASKRYSFYALPEGSDTVLFPGCTLSGSRSETVVKLFEHLRAGIPSLGIVLDCCTKPSRDLGRTGYFKAMFDEMKSYLLDRGVRRVLTACPNCYVIFRDYGAPLEAVTVYEILAGTGIPDAPAPSMASAPVTVHDPCVVRFQKPLHDAVRALIACRGLVVEEMAHHGERAVCCGEGGAAGFLFPELSEKWRAIRRKEAGGRRIVAYCAGCAEALGREAPVVHVLDLLFDPAAALNGESKVSRPPLTYWKRMRMKRRFKKILPAAATRERTFTAGEKASKGSAPLRLVLLLLVIGAIVAVRATGLTSHLDRVFSISLLDAIGGRLTLAFLVGILLAAVSLVPILYRRAGGEREKGPRR